MLVMANTASPVTDMRVIEKDQWMHGMKHV